MRDQAKIDAANERIAQARADLDKAERSFRAVFQRQTAIIKAEQAKVPLTLGLALEIERDGIRDSKASYDFLQDLQWKGAWKGMGIGTSGYWIETNQTQIQLRIPSKMDDVQMLLLEAIILDEVLPVVRPGALVGRGNKGLDKCKVLAMLTNDCGESTDPVLVTEDDKKFRVIDLRDWRWNETAEFEGSLIGALYYIRQRHAHD